MSAKARFGYQQYCRQDVVGADYALLNTSAPDLAPSPDYYVLRLWHALVAQAPGSRVAVLDVAAAGRAMRAYAYCPAAAGRAANVTLLLINLDAAAPACVAAPGFAAPGAPLALYALTPGAGGLEAPVVLLNGVPLKLDAQGYPPAMPPAMVPQAGGITLPPMSIAFVVVPTAPGAVPACA
jgi:hypothetical protein